MHIILAHSAFGIMQIISNTPIKYVFNEICMAQFMFLLFVSVAADYCDLTYFTGTVQHLNRLFKMYFKVYFKLNSFATCFLSGDNKAMLIPTD